MDGPYSIMGDSNDSNDSNGINGINDIHVMNNIYVSTKLGGNSERQNYFGRLTTAWVVEV